MKKHIPNFLTCMNLVVGALGCIAIIKGDLWNAIYFVLLAATFDFLDGFTARLLKVKSAMGKELDSLADVVSFGLLPAFYMQGTINSAGIDPPLLAYLGILIAPFSALRLAKFNIDDRQSEQFIGLPTPANAIMITSFTFIPFTFGAWHLIALTVASCFLLVCNLPMMALKFTSVKVQDNFLKYLMILVSVLFIAFMGIDGVAYIIPSYLILSIVGNFASKKLV